MAVRRAQLQRAALPAGDVRSVREYHEQVGRLRALDRRMHDAVPGSVEYHRAADELVRATRRLMDRYRAKA
jgi:hypothetical protein